MSPMNSQERLIGRVSSELQLKGIVEDSELQVNVTIEGAGPQGVKGDPPKHEWHSDSKSIRFENPDGSWGIPIYLGGVDSYLDLDNKPQIESVELKGNKTFKELGVSPIAHSEISRLL